jgi:Flp pilus assembly protein TadB
MKKLMLVVAISVLAFAVNAQTTTSPAKESKKEKAQTVQIAQVDSETVSSSKSEGEEGKCKHEEGKCKHKEEKCKHEEGEKETEK